LQPVRTSLITAEQTEDGLSDYGGIKFSASRPAQGGFMSLSRSSRNPWQTRFCVVDPAQTRLVGQ
jgi:hypothetical protein